MPKTLEQQLETVQSAIEAIELRGQVVEVDGTRMDRADLGTLYGRERNLRRLIARKESGGIRVRQAVPLDG